MATTTTHYGFTKPGMTDYADISVINTDLDNIDTAIYNNQVRAQNALDNIAPEYDATATYAIGEFCIYEGNLYKCIAAIGTAEPFTPAHWEQTKATEEGGGGSGIDLSYNTSTIQSTETKIGTMNGEDLYIARCYIAQWDSGMIFVWPVMQHMKEIISMDVSYRDSSGKYYTGGYNGEFTMDLSSTYPASFTSSLTRYHVNLIFIYTKK